MFVFYENPDIINFDLKEKQAQFDFTFQDMLLMVVNLHLFDGKRSPAMLARF